MLGDEAWLAVCVPADLCRTVKFFHTQTFCGQGRRHVDTGKSLLQTVGSTLLSAVSLFTAALRLPWKEGVCKQDCSDSHEAMAEVFSQINLNLSTVQAHGLKFKCHDCK